MTSIYTEFWRVPVNRFFLSCVTNIAYFSFSYSSESCPLLLLNFISNILASFSSISCKDSLSDESDSTVIVSVILLCSAWLPRAGAGLHEPSDALCLLFLPAMPRLWQFPALKKVTFCLHASLSLFSEPSVAPPRSTCAWCLCWDPH